MSVLIIEEYNLKDNCDTWNNFVINSVNSNMYQLNEFININSYKCDQVKNLAFKENNKIIATISLGIFRKKLCKSPFSSSFAGFNYIHNLSLHTLKYVVEKLKEYCLENRIEIIEITQPPLIYLKHVDEKIDYALLSNGFKLESYEVCLYKKTKDLLENIKSNLKRNIKKAIINGLIYKKIDKPKECFQFIEEQKRIQGIPFSITYCDFKLLKERYPDKVLMYGVYMDNILISAIIMYSINNKTILGFNWAQDKKYQGVRASDYMLYKSIELALKNGYEFFDFGTTTLNGIINKGVTDFKEKFNPDSVLRKKYVYKN